MYVFKKTPNPNLLFCAVYLYTVSAQEYVGRVIVTGLSSMTTPVDMMESHESELNIESTP